MLQWLVVGIGDIATKRVIPSIQAEPRSSLAAVVTRHPNKAVSYQVPAFFSLEEALRRGTFDAVTSPRRCFCMGRKACKLCMRGNTFCAKSLWR